MSKKSIVKITEKQKEKLEKLWFIYGNNGKNSTLFNYKYIQGFLEANEDRKEHYIKGRSVLKERGFFKRCHN